MSSLNDFCNMIGAAIACLIGTCIVAELAYRGATYVNDFDELPEVPLNQYNVISLRKYESAGVFLFNHSVEAHHEFLHDVKIANSRHAVTVFQLDCMNHKSVCGSLGHGQMHEYEEPPVLFYHKGEWSESYHDDLQQDIVPKPESRRQRVKTIVAWLDQAHKRGRDKLHEREMMLNRLSSVESPSQRMMREMREKNEKGEAKKTKVEL